MSDHEYEITIVARNAKNETAEVHAEITTSAATPHDAARALLDPAVKAYGNSRVREIDPAR